MDHNKMMGFVTDGDKRVTLPVRFWDAMKLALWRSQVAWDAVVPQAKLILAQCAHAPGCPGKDVETEPCSPDCPDREQRLSVLVILNAGRQFAPVDARRIADGPYFAPTREWFSEVIASLVAAQAELDAMHAQGHGATPPANAELPASFKPAKWQPPAPALEEPNESETSETSETSDTLETPEES